jgi:hypothetical protein
MSLSDRPIPEVLDRPLWHFYAVGVIVLILSGWLWWAKFYTAPTHVFWGMINNSLSTERFVTEVDHRSGHDSVKQTIHTDTQGRQARSYLELVQGNTKIKKEVVGTRAADFTRFLMVDSSQKYKNGKPLDVSSILGVWSKSDGTPQSEASASDHQLYAQAVLGVGLPLGSVPVPVGKVSVRERQAIVERMKSEHIYQPDYAAVKKERKNGRLLYTYDIKIQAILYIRLMQTFGALQGLDELAKVDPNTYSDTGLLSVKLTVEAVSHRLAAVDSGQGFTLRYTSYDVPLVVSLPQKTIAASELQRRLDELQSQ